jgi:CheY-like chemotaxis protein
VTTILVADDDAAVRRLLCMALELDGYTLLEAADGDEAWTLLHAHHPRLALLDVDMPGRGGLWLTRSIRLDPALSSTRVILLSAWSGELDVRAGLEAGADRYLAKPIKPSELAAVVREVLAAGGRQSLR